MYNYCDTVYNKLRTGTAGETFRKENMSLKTLLSYVYSCSCSSCKILSFPEIKKRTTKCSETNISCIHK